MSEETHEDLAETYKKAKAYTLRKIEADRMEFTDGRLAVDYTVPGSECRVVEKAMLDACAETMLQAGSKEYVCHLELHASGIFNRKTKYRVMSIPGLF